MDINRGTKIEMILMNKNIPVANVVFGMTGIFNGIRGFYNKEKMPIGTNADDNFVEKRFYDWLQNRSIPKKRPKIEEFMKKNKLTTPMQYYFKNHGLSLTDPYWFLTKKQYKNNLKWENVNYFQHNYSNFVGEYLLDFLYTNQEQDYNSPNFTTNGDMPKMWVKQANKDILYKGGTKQYQEQEVFHEVLFSEIAYRLNANYVNYELTQLQDKKNQLHFFCKCENFCNENWEFVPAKNFMIEQKTFGRKGFAHYIHHNNQSIHYYNMLILDFIFSNVRTDNDYGVLKDNETDEILGMAPIFDCGSSLGCDFNSLNRENYPMNELVQIKDLSFLDLDSLDNIEHFARDLFSKSNIEEKRIDKTINLLMSNIEKLKKLYIEKNGVTYITKKNNKPTISKKSNGFG